MKCQLVIAFLFIACVRGEVDDSVPNLQDIAGNFQGLVPGFDPSQFNTSQVPTVEDAERLFKEKCLKNSNEAAYNKAKDAQDKARECIMSLVNVTALQDEIELAKPTGDLDEVFKKYCRKTPAFRHCVSNFTSSIEPCLDTAERESKHIIQNVTDKLIEFICFKEGDRIALFIAEGGPECIQSNSEGIQVCVNTTLKRHIPSEVPSVENLPMLIMGLEECKDMRRLQACIVKTLGSCSEPTPGNIVDSMFNFVYKVTPCGLLPEPQAATNVETQQSEGSGSIPTVALASLLAIVATRFL